MKYFLLSILFCSSLWIQGQSFNLEVINGYGSGTYLEGDSVHIWSYPCTDKQVFLKWTGAAKQFLEFQNEWHTVLIVPKGTGVKNMKLTANFDTLPKGIMVGVDHFPMEGIDTNFQRVAVVKPVYYRIPPHPKAVVLLFHGTNGSGTTYFTRYERVQLIKDFLYNGYAVFGLDCNERTMGDVKKNGKIQWLANDAGMAEPNNNIDLENVQETIKQLLKTHKILNNLPLFSFGVSNGANFSDLVAAVFDFKASAHVTATGRDGTYRRDDVTPIIWVMSENDHQEQADNARAFNNYQVLSKKHPTSEFHIFKRSPMFPERFMRNSGNVSESKSINWYHELENRNLLDERHFLSNFDVESFLDDFTNAVHAKKNEKKGIQDQLMCANADHTLSADYNKNIIRFFDSQLDRTTKIKDIALPESLEIYPNPVSKCLFIKTNENYNRYHLYNLNGQMVLNGNIDQNRIDISHLAPNLYILRVMNKETQKEQFARVLVVK